ncbi:MAG: porin [Alphaproteobacteria bacterium]|nr:porin [Alphaproteobacteria bacterium]
MKKQLLATTALVAAGLLGQIGTADAQKAQAPKIEIKGSMEMTVGLTIGQDEGAVGNRVRGLDIFNETEIHFIGTATLDNGISFRAVVELEGDGDGTPAPGINDPIDESYLIIRGAFGQLTLGSTDHAAVQMVTGNAGSFATQVGQNLTFDTNDWVPAPPGHVAGRGGSPVNDPRPREPVNDDAEKITYYTPRFEGFQFGVSYTPNHEQDQNASAATTDSVYNEGWAFGLNFDRKFDQVGIGIGVGYAREHAPESAPTVPDDSTWAVGASISYMGFKIAGAYRKQNDRRDTPTSNATSLEGERWEIGAQYVWGPNAVSFVYGEGKARGVVANPGNDELKNSMIAYRREIGPGVFWYGNLLYANYQGEDNNSLDDNKAFAISSGVRLNF